MSSSERAGPLAPIYGRDPDLRRVRALQRDGARLITLTGPPGIGKTRIARALCETEPNAAFVELAGADDGDEVAARVAGGLDLRLSWLGTASYEEELGYALEGRGAFTLVLDEVDASLELLGGLLRRWLTLAPELAILLTCRSALAVDFERAVEIRALPVGDDPLSGPSGQLLLARAGLEPPRDHEVYNRLLTALDGIPLAIELAAARLSVLPPDEITQRLNRELDVLSAPRHAGRATLREGLEHAARALSPDEADAFARCAVFPGWFDVRLAERVLGDGALDRLATLRHRSLLAQDPARTRLRLYGPVRAFARERAQASGVWADAVDRHARAMVAEVEACKDHPDAYRQLAPRIDGLRAAFEHLAPGAARDTVGLALGRVCSVRGPNRETLAVYDQLLESDNPRVACEAQLGRSRALLFAGRVDEAIPLLTNLTAPQLAVEVETTLAEAELSRGQLESARSHAARARSSLSDSVSPTDRVQAHRTAGRVAHAAGQLEDARGAYETGRRWAARHGLHTHAAQLMADLGAVRLAQRRLEEAEELYRAALSHPDTRLDPVTVGLAEGNLAILQQELGRFDEAAEHYARGREQLRRVGHRHYAAHLVGYAGSLEHERGRLDEAVALYAEASDVLAVVGDARLGAMVAGLTGAAEAARGRLAASEEAFARAAEHLERVDDRGVATAVDLLRGHLDLARSPSSDAGRDEANRRLDAAGADALERSDDARLARRLLASALRRGTLILDEARRAVRLPDGSGIDLEKRDVLFRLVLALVRWRREHPGEALSTDALIEAGWPGERMQAQSASNRLKVSLSTLRKLGLRPVLQRHDGGYRLDPTVPVS